MAQNDAENLKKIWNKSKYKTDGEELELFKDIDFIEHGVKDADLYFNGVVGISENVDVDFLSGYLVHRSSEMLVFRIPVHIEFDLNMPKLRQYFKQISMGTYRYDKTHYMLRLYLFKNLTYQYNTKYLDQRNHLRS